MRKELIVTLGLLGAIAIAAGSALWGFYEGMQFEAKAMTGITQHTLARYALHQVRFSMVALGKSDLNMSQQELELDLREALINLSPLSKTDAFVQCTDMDTKALADAGDYLATHPNSAIFGLDPYWESGIKFCHSQQRYPKAVVSYMTTGK
jgi:hypothetical protein